MANEKNLAIGLKGKGLCKPYFDLHCYQLRTMELAVIQCIEPKEKKVIAVCFQLLQLNGNIAEFYTAL